VTVIPVDAIARRWVLAQHFPNGPGAGAALGRLGLGHYSVSDLEGHEAPPFDSLRVERTTSEDRRQPVSKEPRVRRFSHARRHSVVDAPAAALRGVERSLTHVWTWPEPAGRIE
jgi:hypothetical protein